MLEGSTETVHMLDISRSDDFWGMNRNLLFIPFHFPDNNNLCNRLGHSEMKGSQPL